MERRHWRLAGAAGALALLIALTGSRAGAAAPGRGPQVEHYTGPGGATATPLPLCTIATSTPYPTATPYPTQPPYYCFPWPTQPPYPTSTPYPCPYCPTSTLTPTSTPTNTPTLAPSPTPTWTPSSTPTATPTFSGQCILQTSTPYPTYTPLPTLTRRPTGTPCYPPNTPLPSYTPNPTYTPTITPTGFYPTPSPLSGTPSPPPLPSSTSTVPPASPTPPPTATSCLDCFTPTATKTATAASTATAAGTASAVRTATRTSTPRASVTWPPPTHGPCPFPPCITNTPTATASATPTNTPCTLRFADVHATDYFYTPVQYLACHGVISGYADGTFRPYANTTRAQMVKIVVLGFGLPLYTPPAGWPSTFADVPPAQPFYAVIETAAVDGVVSGYTCGGPGEPCDAGHRPYFRPNADVTRGQLSKIVVATAGWAPQTPAGPTFADVAPGSAFYPFVETAACHNIVSGYTCGGPGEPCDTQGRPYFRPNADVTRGQLSKIVVATAGWALQTPAGGTFADVAPGSAFYPFVETAACHNIISGYTCGGPGEPCDAEQRPYFRPGTPATRGQIAKIVYGALTAAPACGSAAPAVRSDALLVTGTPTVTATPTTFYCSFYALGASSTCGGPDTYNYAFDFHNTCPNIYGTIHLYFDVAADGTGPWTQLDAQQLSGVIGTHIAGSLNEPNIPPQDRYYRIRTYVTMINWSDDNVTPAAYLCNLPPTPTPCPLCASPTPTVCTPGWSDIPGPTDGALWSVDGTSATDVWAAGEYEATSSHPSTHIRHWDGTAWQVIPSVHGAGPNNYLYGVSALAPDNAWTVGWYFNSGTGEQTLIEHWDGSAWSLVPSPNVSNDSGLQAISALGPNDIWAAGSVVSGSYEGQVLIVHWDGSQWSRIPTPLVPTYPFLQSITALAPNDVWAAGYYGTYQALTLHWDGSQWTRVANPAPGNSQLYAIKGRASNDVWAVGYAQGQTLTLHWDGVQWSVIPSPSFAEGSSLAALAPLAADDVWAAGAHAIYGVDQQTLVLHWDGTQWTTLTSPSPGADINNFAGLFAPTRDTLWAVGSTGSVYTGRRWYIAHYTVACPPVLTPSATPSPPPTATATMPPTHPATASPPPGAPSATATRPASASPTRSATAPAVPTRSPAASPSATETPTTLPPPPATRTAPPGASATPCAVTFADVYPTDYFYTPVQYLACHGVISGYADGTFRPYANTTRGQMVKIVVLGFGRVVTTPAGGIYTFADVPPAQPFFAVIETAAADGIVSGYTCGGPGEPCDAGHRPYFRPNADVTRGQLSKIVVATAGWAPQTPAGPTFADVAPGSAFYSFVETAACHGIISGYTCGGPGEPCDAGSRPYFRQYNNATRGQIAKIVYGALTGGSTCLAAPGSR